MPADMLVKTDHNKILLYLETKTNIEILGRKS